MTDREVNFLRDLPAEEDLLGAAHSRIANVLADRIACLDEGHSVALLGGWGSGKSTVLRLMEKKLNDKEEKQEFWVWTYDAWSHEGDVLRRSFLSDFAVFIMTKRGLPRGQRKRLEDEIWQDQLTIRKTSVPMFSIPGLVIVGVSIVLAFMFGDIDFTLGFPEYLKDPLNIELALTILVGLVALWLIQALYRWIKQGILPQEAFNPGYLLQIVLDRKEGTTQEIESTQSADKSAYKFGELFTKILRLAKLQAGKRKLVIIIDNIDRLPLEKARLFWSTLAPFFERRSQSRDGQPYWLIVPFDIDALAKVLDYISSDPKEDGVAITAGFIEKSFDLILHTPPPTLSNWQQFFGKFLREALPGIDDKEYATILKIYDGMRNAPHTPRKMKRFINELGLLHLSATEQIPIAVLAYYILWSNDPGDYSADPKASLIPLLPAKDILDPMLAALKHGVANIDEAMSEILLGPTQKALRDCDRIKLAEFTKYSGFEAVLEKAVEYEVSKNEDLQSNRVLAPLFALSDFHTDQSNTIMRVWEWIAESATKIRKWDDPSAAAGIKSIEDSPEAIELVLANLPNPKSRAQFIDGFGIVLSEAELPARIVANEMATAWTTSVNKLLENDWSPDTIKVPDQSDFAVSVISCIPDFWSEKTTRPRFYFGSDANEIANAIVARTSQDISLQWSARIVEGAIFAWSDEAAAAIGAELNQLLDATDLPTQQAVRCAVLSAFNASMSPDGVGPLQTLIDNGQWWHHLGRSSGVPMDAAVFVIAIMFVIPDFNARPGWNASENGLVWFDGFLANMDQHTGVLEAMAELFAYPMFINKIFVIQSEGNRTYPIYLAVLRYILEKKDKIAVGSAEVIANWDKVQSLQDDIRRAFLESLSNFDDLLAGVIEDGFDEERYHIYRELLPITVKNSRTAFLNFLSEGLGQLNAADWHAELLKPIDGPGSALGLVRELNNAGKNIKVGASALECFVNLLPKIREFEVESSEDSVIRYQFLANQMNKASRHKLTVSIADELINSGSVDEIEQLLFCFGRIMLDDAEFAAKKRAKPLVGGPLTLILSAPNSETAEWLETIAEEAPRSLRRAGRPEYLNFQKKLKEAIAAAVDDDIKDHLVAAAKALGLKV